MQPRGLKDEMIINNSKYRIDPNNSLEDINGNNSFDYGKIITYCSYCNTKHKLEYSGYFPKQIGYRCNKCEETITILDTGYNDFNINFVAEAVQSTVQNRESFALGYNYATKNNRQDTKDFYKGVERYVSGRLYHHLALTLFLLSSIIALLGFILLLGSPISIVPILISYPVGVIVIFSLVDWLIEKHRRSEIEIKDSIISENNMSPIWISKGIEEVYPKLSIKNDLKKLEPIRSD